MQDAAAWAWRAIWESFVSVEDGGGVLLATFCAMILVRFPRRDSNMSKQADWAVELAFCFVLWVVEADIEVPKFQMSSRSYVMDWIDAFMLGIVILLMSLIPAWIDDSCWDAGSEREGRDGTEGRVFDHLAESAIVL